MDCPEFTTAAELREDLAKFESMWCVFEEFNTGLQELRKEDWISFRYLSFYLSINWYSFIIFFRHVYTLKNKIFISFIVIGIFLR